MSLVTPNQAVPISVYSIKATFVTERDSGGEPIAASYVLKIRVAGTTTWTRYAFGPAALYCFIENLEPYTQYETQWELTQNGVTTTSSSYFFYTHYSERFPLRPALPTPMYGEDFPNALQAELDAHIDYINTMDDEKAIERYLKEGTGKIVGCDLILSGPQNLSMSNGWFQSGSGYPDSDIDHPWFPGAKLFQIASTTGAKEIIAPDSDVLTQDGYHYGYASGYFDTDGAPVLDIIWPSVADNTVLPATPTNGRWIIGRINVVGGIITEVDTTRANQIPTLLYLQQIISSLSGGGGGGGGTGGPSLGSAADLKFDPADIDIPFHNTFDVVNAKIKDLKDYMDAKFKELKPGQETSLEYFISNFARSCVSWGINNPAGLLRIDASIILPEQYGQEGIILELDGESVPSPVYGGAGNLAYNSTLKLWEV